MTERDLVQRCQAGERESQRQLFERTSLSVYRLLLRMTGDPDDAADLTQETYVKAFERLHRFDGRSAVATWLCRIAMNEALQLRRRRGTAKRSLRLHAVTRADDTAESTGDLRMDLDAALAELPPHDRAVLLLRYQQGLDYRAISEVLECAQGTVASRLNRARDRLRDLLRTSYA